MYPFFNLPVHLLDVAEKRKRAATDFDDDSKQQYTPIIISVPYVVPVKVDKLPEGVIYHADNSYIRKVIFDTTLGGTPEDDYVVSKPECIQMTSVPAKILKQQTDIEMLNSAVNFVKSNLTLDVIALTFLLEYGQTLSPQPNDSTDFISRKVQDAFAQMIQDKDPYITQNYPSLKEGYDIGVLLPEMTNIRYAKNGGFFMVHSDYAPESDWLALGFGATLHPEILQQVQAQVGESPNNDGSYRREWEQWSTSKKDFSKQYYYWKFIKKHYDIIALNYWVVLNMDIDETDIQTEINPTLAVMDVDTVLNPTQLTQSVLPGKKDFEILTTYKPPPPGHVNKWKIRPGMRFGDSLVFETLRGAHCAVDISNTTLGNKTTPRASVDMRAFFLKRKGSVYGSTLFDELAIGTPYLSQ